jgi:predicted TPR repeat methyltransferase
VAAAFEGRARSFEGADLSPNMLSEARRKGLYRHLHEADIVDFLAAGNLEAGDRDLVTAGDVFIYVGDLEAVFAGVSRCLSDGGLFAFSVESVSDAPYRLRPSGRYAQSDAYIRSLAITHGFDIAAAEDVIVRLEREAPILGAVYVLQKSAA